MLACLLSFIHYITSVMLSVLNGLFGVSLLSLPIAMNKITIVNTTSLFCDMLEHAKISCFQHIQCLAPLSHISIPLVSIVYFCVYNLL